jgi:hypothetical protein
MSMNADTTMSGREVVLMRSSTTQPTDDHDTFPHLSSLPLEAIFGEGRCRD